MDFKHPGSAGRWSEMLDLVFFPPSISSHHSSSSVVLFISFSNMVNNILFSRPFVPLLIQLLNSTHILIRPHRCFSLCPIFAYVFLISLVHGAVFLRLQSSTFFSWVRPIEFNRNYFWVGKHRIGLSATSETGICFRNDVQGSGNEMNIPFPLQLGTQEYRISPVGSG